MQRIDIRSFFHVGCLVEVLIQIGEGHDAIKEEGLTTLRSILKDIQDDLKRLEMHTTLAIAKHAQESLKVETTWSEQRAFASCIKTSANTELAEIFVGYIPAHRSKYWKLEKPFNVPVYDSFPSARVDATAAGSCFAIQEYTACVFHLMRVAEIGLRALARERRVILKQKLEWADWGAIIGALEKKVDAISNKKRGPARGAALDFYRGILGEYHSFRDVYRNHVMHTRETYTEPQAASVMLHVSEFMQRLAAKISETNSKQIRWGIR